MSRTGRTVCFQAELLEHRMLPSSGWLAIQARGPRKEVVSLAVPSTYVSQSATEIDLTIARRWGRNRFRSTVRRRST